MRESFWYCLPGVDLVFKQSRFVFLEKSLLSSGVKKATTFKTALLFLFSDFDEITDETFESSLQLFMLTIINLDPDCIVSQDVS